MMDITVLKHGFSTASNTLQSVRVDPPTGLLLVLEAMRDCGRPAVGHSVYLDLVFTLQALSAPLPRTWSRFRRHANSWFPGGLFDSKHIASCIPEVGRSSP